MVLAGLGDAWIRFLGARDSARLAPRHSQQTPLPATTLRAPGRVVAALLFRSLSWNLDASLGLTYRLHSIRNHWHTYERDRQPERSRGPPEPLPLTLRSAATTADSTVQRELMQCLTIGD